MALSTGLITSTTFLSGESSSPLAKPSLRFAYPTFPASLRMSPRTPTLLAAVSKQAGAAATTPREPRGIMKPRKVSPEMQALVGVPEISRTQALKVIWAHIKGNNLQDPENKRIIVCDDKLKKIFAGKDRVGFLEVAGLITPHFL
ncbi:PREDICTED: protein TRI1 [Fragaria vesca subsp. vesca]|uniref:protein TRI1 n=1 Tax=Fragaria vesca subsp. vesca TaxID=101020 RepID=UPI0002C328E7|nr:PREDICTED: protein TRI1 [Fragaria vesca subsp. vesca]